MSIFHPTKIYGRVEALLVNSSRDADLTSDPTQQVNVTYAGFEGEDHGGLTRPACVRVKKQYPRDTEIKNARQFTVLSSEELAEIGENMGLPEPVRPEWIGANLVLSGIPDLTMLPPASRLIFENGTGLVVDSENGPCRYPAEIIESVYPGKGMSFPKIALGKRGLVGWVEREGSIKIGDTCRLHIPEQRIYSHA